MDTCDTTPSVTPPPILEQNHDALLDFFARVHPKYASRRWFITGYAKRLLLSVCSGWGFSSSYAGIYIPTVVQRLLRSIAAVRFPNPRLQVSEAVSFTFSPTRTGNEVQFRIGSFGKSVHYWLRATGKPNFSEV